MNDQELILRGMKLCLDAISLDENMDEDKAQAHIETTLVSLSETIRSLLQEKKSEAWANLTTALNSAGYDYAGHPTHVCRRVKKILDDIERAPVT